MIFGRGAHAPRPNLLRCSAGSGLCRPHQFTDGFLHAWSDLDRDVRISVVPGSVTRDVQVLVLTDEVPLTADFTAQFAAEPLAVLSVEGASELIPEPEGDFEHLVAEDAVAMDFCQSLGEDHAPAENPAIGFADGCVAKFDVEIGGASFKTEVFRLSLDDCHLVSVAVPPPRPRDAI